MDWQGVFNLLGASATTILGWFANTIWSAHKELRKELNEHRVEVARDYVSHERFSETLSEVKDSLRRIELKIDRGGSNER